MAFPNRALIAAPIARDLHAEHPDHWVARVPGASNGTLQIWDTLDQDFWQALADPALSGWGTLDQLRTQNPGVYKYVVQAQRSDKGTSQVNVAFKRLIDMTAADFWRVIRSDGTTVVRQGQPIAGDVRPAGAYRTAWSLMHEWAGLPADTLGA